MRHDRRIKMITIVILVVVVFGLSIGFAVYSKNLNISNAQATVKGDPTKFDVVLSTSSTNASTGTVTGTYSRTNSDSTGSAGTATLSGTTISNLTATFTKGAGSVKYTFYAYNKGSISAYLNSARISNSSCHSNDASESLVKEACKDIQMVLYQNTSIGVGTEFSIPFTGSSAIATGKSQEISLTIRYSNEHPVDGDFVVTLPDVSYTFSSQPLVLGPS